MPLHMQRGPAQARACPASSKRSQCAAQRGWLPVLCPVTAAATAEGAVRRLSSLPAHGEQQQRPAWSWPQHTLLPAARCREAKVSVLEWDCEAHCVRTGSLHCLENERELQVRGVCWALLVSDTSGVL